MRQVVALLGPSVGGCSHSGSTVLHLSQAQAAAMLPLTEPCVV